MINLIKRLIDAGSDWADLDTRAENLLCQVEEHMKPIHPGGDLAGILEDGEWEFEDETK
jgi:hypothetical protein